MTKKVYKTTWTARVSSVVKEYFQKRNISAGQIIAEKFREAKKNERTELLKERTELLNRVTQIDEIVTHLDSQCNTNWDKCNTLFKKIVLQSDWYCNTQRIQTILEKNDIYDITPEKFIDHYKSHTGEGE